MKHHRTRKAVSLLLSLLMAVQLLPLEAGAASAMEGKKAGDVLFNNGEKDRLFVSETAYSLAPGITEYVTYTNEPDGLNQNIDYFCEVDLSQAEVMTGYAGMENILEKKTINWRMQTVSGQVEDTQSYFTRSEKYADCTIAAALNADYYNMATGQPTGLLIIDGKVYNPSSGGYYFGIDKKSGKAVISNDKSDAALAELSYAVGGGSLLVKDGKVNVGNGGRNVTYSAIGIKPDGTVVSMVCYGQSYPISCGYNQYEVAQMMKARGCQTAVLLDGSGSSTFVSRRDGDSKPQTRNHPSDGQERQVSSSIFFISRAKADGIFDHATIAPTNEVYTPGSKVKFTAAGADRSGAPAPLPSGLTWTVDAAYGNIDSATGVFQSNGKAGDVRVYLNQGGTQVGSAIITIAAPDQITFAEASVSMGNGDTGDLGLRVYYQQREVHYRDGDLDWSIQPTQYSRKEYVSGTRYETVTETNPNRMQCLTVGTVSNNKLTIAPVYTGTNLRQGADYTLAEIEKTATAITATVTVSSKTNPGIKGSVTLNACKEPQVALDFETENANIFHGLTQDGASDFRGEFVDGTYTAFSEAKNEKTLKNEGYDVVCVSYVGRQGGSPQIGTATIVNRADGYPVRFGDNSLKVGYDIPGNPSGTDGVCFGPTEEIDLSTLGNPSRIGIWVYIPANTPNLWLRLRYRDGSGNTSQVDFTENDIYRPNNVARNADNGWHYFEADISHLQTPVTIPAGMAVRIMYCAAKQSQGAAKAWASPVGWVKCKTDANGNIILTDRTDARLTSFTTGEQTGLNIGATVPETVTLSTTKETVKIDKVPIPEYLATFGSGGACTGTLPYKGSLYFDNLTFVYGSTTEDKTNPVIESVIVNQEKELQTGMSFESSSIDIQATYRDSVADDRNNTGVDYAALYSMGAVTVSVTAKLLGGAQSASAQVTCGQTDGSVSMGGITYTVNAEKLIAALPEIDLVEGENQMKIPPELKDAKAELEEAANAEDNGLNGLNASLAAGAEDLVRKALGETEMPESGVELKTYGSMTVVEYVPGTSYTVDIVPSFELSEKDSEAEPIAKGVIANAQLKAPVEVVLKVPAGIPLDENTYVRHIHADGSSNYIKPHRIEGKMLYFYTDSFSRFQVVSDSRSARIAFPTEDGVQVRIYGPENIGTELPSVEAPEGKTFKGWKIGEETYTSVTEELLNALADAEDTVQAEPVFQDKEQGGGTIPGGGGGIRVETYPITVAAVENGAVSLDQKSAAEGDTVTITAKAEEGHQLKSIAAVGEDGAAIALTDKGNGTYQFTMPGTAVEIRVEFVEEKTFPDVAEGSYCDEAVKWAVKNGITLGFANGLFAPGQSCTRAQIVTFLWRTAGSPAPKTTVNPFQDIQESMFCYQAVLWAVENGVTKGTTETTFSPNDTCTRGQSVTFLYRAVGMQTESQVTFPDVAADSYCADAVAWAVENGVTKGLANGLFGPNENCTRGQIVTFLYRTYTKAN